MTAPFLASGERRVAWPRQRQRIERLVQELYLRHQYTSEHQYRVRNYCLLVADELKASQYLRHCLAMAALLHDIGKLRIKSTTLDTKGPLSQKQVDVLRDHPLYSGYITARIGAPLPVYLGILHHHQWWSGVRIGTFAGGPLSHSGRQIPLISRIISITDAYDAMTTTRLYNTICTKDEALRRILVAAGDQFAPNLAHLFVAKVGPKLPETKMM